VEVTSKLYRHGDGILLLRFDIPAGTKHHWVKRITKGSHAWIMAKGSGWIHNDDRRTYTTAGDTFCTEPGEEFSCEAKTDSVVFCICDTSDDDQRFDTIGDKVWPNPKLCDPLEVW
jgi:quercetin dioxygenase-like cupin family protein